MSYVPNTSLLNEILYCSPVIFLLEVADRDKTGSTAQGKLVLQWGPLHTCGCTVDAYQD